MYFINLFGFELLDYNIIYVIIDAGQQFITIDSCIILFFSQFVFSQLNNLPNTKTHEITGNHKRQIDQCDKGMTIQYFLSLIMIRWRTPKALMILKLEAWPGQKAADITIKFCIINFTCLIYQEPCNFDSIVL